MVRTWNMPPTGYIKINVHAINYNAYLPNGNNSSIGVVLRDDNGDILLMVSGSIRNITPMANQLWAMLIGLRYAFYEDENNVILETESTDAVKEWEEWRWFHDANNKNIIEQLDKRKEDNKLKLDVKIIEESQNLLARFLAEDGAFNRTRLVVFRRPFGRVREIWHLEMGLGLLEERFDFINEEDYNAAEAVEMGYEVQGVGDLLVQDDESANVQNVV